jgi:type IV secretion system protein VirD4
MFGSPKLPDPDKYRHGSAEWTEANDDMKWFNDPRPGNAIPLGLLRPDSNTGVKWNTEELQGHGLCFAPTRTGKGTSVIIPALLTYGGSMFVIDPKGENAWITAAYRRRMGHNVVVLDPWNEVSRFAQQKNAERSTSFNPLSFIHCLVDGKPNPEFIDDIEALAAALIITEPNSSHPYFPDTARRFLVGLIALVKELHKEKATMRQVYDLATGEKSTWVELLNEVNRLYTEYGMVSVANQKLRSFVDDDTNAAKDVRSTMLTQINFLGSPALLDSMENDDKAFDINSFSIESTTIYVVIPADKLHTHGAWLRLMIVLALRAITRNRTPEIPVMMLIDEMGTIGPLKQIEAAYGLLAGYGVRVFGFFQSLSQLQADYKDWRTMLGNCSIVQVLGERGETADYFSKILGKRTLIDSEPRPEGGLWNDREEYTARPLMDADEIRTELGADPVELWSNKQLIFKAPGWQKILALQNPYFKRKAWREWYRNPPGKGSA